MSFFENFNSPQLVTCHRDTQCPTVLSVLHGAGMLHIFRYGFLRLPGATVPREPRVPSHLALARHQAISATTKTKWLTDILPDHGASNPHTEANLMKTWKQRLRRVLPTKASMVHLELEALSMSRQLPLARLPVVARHDRGEGGLYGKTTRTRNWQLRYRRALQSLKESNSSDAEGATRR
jgi:hypothetical protein